MPTAGTITISAMIPRLRRDILGAIGQDSTRYLEAFNRVQLNLLRYADWKWLNSAALTFITEEEQTDYFVGTGTAPLGSVNTGLNLSDIGRLMDSSVFDRSNHRQLARTDEPPLNDQFAFDDGTMRRDKPRLYRNAPDTPYVVNIYPAPDNLNAYQQIPPTPVLTSTGSGSGSIARFLYSVVTLVDSFGNESTPSDVAAKQYIPADAWAKVSSPNPKIIQGTAGVRYDRWNVYVGTAPGSLFLQNASPINVGTDWTQSGALLTAT